MGQLVAAVFIIGTWLVSLAVPIVVICVAVHFICKLW